MEQFLNSTWEALKERMRNPFVGTFLIIFFSWNWRAFLYLFFSDTDMGTKVIDYENYMFQYFGLVKHFPWTQGVALFFNMMIPAGLAIAYLKFMPVFSHWLERQTKDIVEKRKDWINEIMIGDLKRDKKLLEEGNSLEKVRKKYEEETGESADAFIKEQETKAATIDLDTGKVKTRKLFKDSEYPKQSDHEILLNKIEKDRKLEGFIDVSREVNKKSEISSDDENANYFVELGLIEAKELGYNGRIGYMLTNVGQEVLRLARLREK